PKVAVEIVHVRVDRFGHGVAAVAEMQRRRRGNRHLRQHARVRFDELEMLYHRMAGKDAEFSGHAQQHRLWVRTLELDLALAEIGLDAGKRTEEIVIPEGAAEFAVGDGFQADLFLAFDDGRDLAVFDGPELIAGDFTKRALGARMLERQGAQQAADMIRAKRRTVP